MDSYFLYRLTRSGIVCGDTWHHSVDDAIAQAEFEYGGLIGSWKEVPDKVDAFNFALEKSRDQKT